MGLPQARPLLSLPMLLSPLHPTRIALHVFVLAFALRNLPPLDHTGPECRDHASIDPNYAFAQGRAQ